MGTNEPLGKPDKILQEGGGGGELGWTSTHSREISNAVNRFMLRSYMPAPDESPGSFNPSEWTRTLPSP